VERRARHGSGSVLVRDVVEKNVMLRKGKRYTARPPADALSCRPCGSFSC
jgi:hypothetical protein